MEEEADGELVGGGEGVGSGVGEELEGHAGGVVGDAVEIWVGGGEVGEAEEGLEAAVGAELDVYSVERFACQSWSRRERGVGAFYGVFPAPVTVAFNAWTISAASVAPVMARMGSEAL